MKKEQIAVIKEAVNLINANQVNTVFHVDEKTRACVAIWTGVHRTGVGVAVCNPMDRWIKPIGKVIAMYRAKGRKVPDKYLHFGCDHKGYIN